MSAAEAMADRAREADDIRHEIRAARREQAEHQIRADANAEFRESPCSALEAITARYAERAAATRLRVEGESGAVPTIAGPEAHRRAAAEARADYAMDLLGPLLDAIGDSAGGDTRGIAREATAVFEYVRKRYIAQAIDDAGLDS